MYHSITFGDKNTWDDWHLIPSSRPVFSPPQPVAKMIQIPGKSGSLDLTELLSGQVVYADRTGSIEFYVQHEYWDSWVDAYQTVMNYLHGQKMQAVLEDDSAYYYEGRFSVNEYRSNPNWSTIVINYVIQPFKMSLEEYGNDWLWDPFDFETGVIDSLIDLEATADGRVVILEGYGYRTIPLIHCYSAGIYLYFDKYETPIKLSKGDNRPSLAVITPGKHELRFVGKGQKFDIHYRGGSL